MRKSISELGYRGQQRVDGVESPRHGADAATEARGAPDFDFHTDVNSSTTRFASYNV